MNSRRLSLAGYLQKLYEFLKTSRLANDLSQTVHDIFWILQIFITILSDFVNFENCFTQTDLMYNEFLLFLICCTFLAEIGAEIVVRFSYSPIN